MTFDANKSSTWDENQNAVYETGYREGGSNERADWLSAISEIVDDVSNPQELQALLERLTTAKLNAPIEIEMVPVNSGFPTTLKIHALVVIEVHEIHPGETFRAEWTWPPNDKPTKLRWVLVEDVS